MQYVFVIENNQVKDAYEFHVEKGFMLRKEDFIGIDASEIEDKLKAQSESVSKLRETDNEIVYEVK
jgi:hypothetical protein